MKLAILIVDDERVQRETLADLLSQHHDRVVAVANANDAIKAIETSIFDIVLTDYKMPGGSGLDVARKAREWSPDTAVILMTAYADVAGVIEAMRVGVLDYLIKPINVDALLSKLRLLGERRELLTEVTFLRDAMNRGGRGNARLTGDSPATANVQALIERVAASEGTVLITGESGTGKEVAARQIHQLSARVGRRFVAINCGAIPEHLLESELFGYKKGAFTGAVADKEGLFSYAHEGTLFLDEIGELPKSLQVKLLRALQEREVTPVGGKAPQKIDVRLLCATNRDLDADVESGAFRRDLFYRINVIAIQMPALRERSEDIPALAAALLEKVAARLKKPVPHMATEALRRLMVYQWPGNVRELENVLERAMILSRGAGRIEVSDLPVGFQTLGEGDDAALTLEDAVRTFTRSHIAKVLEAAGGNKKDAAKLLGMSLSSMYRKLEDLGLSGARGEDGP